MERQIYENFTVTFNLTRDKRLESFSFLLLDASRFSGAWLYRPPVLRYHDKYEQTGIAR
jgi:hypothetical protein